MISHNRERRGGVWIASLCWCCLLLVAIPTVLAQRAVQFKSDPVAADLRNSKSREFRDLQKKKRKILSGSISLAAERASFDRWYSEYWLPVMTSPANSGRLAEGRRKLIQDLVMCGDTPDVHKRLTMLVYDFGRKVAQQNETESDNYHPAVRFNGVLLLGHLNDKEAVLLGERRPPVPYREAFGRLVTYAADDKQIDAVRLAALLGVKRHVELRTKFPQFAGQLATNEQTTVLTNMAKLVSTDQPPPGRTRDGHDWMRAIAAETLGLFGIPGPNSTAVSSLVKLVGQSDATLSARCAAAKALGSIDFGTSKPNASTIVDPIVGLAADCCEAERQLLNGLLADEAAAEADGGRRRSETNAFFVETEPGSKSGPRFKDERSVPTRRRLLSQLIAIREGLIGSDGKSGLRAIAANEVSVPVQQIEATIAALREPATDIQQLSDALTKLTLSLQELAGVAAQPPAAKPAPTATATATGGR